MPPWLPEAGYGHFQDERRLTEEQIRAIAAWVAAGEPEGLREDLPPPPPERSDWQLGRPDLIVTAQSPFVVPAAGSDVFWNFTFAPELESTRYVKAMEIRPAGSRESIRIVHHANLLVDRSGSARRLETKPGSGFPGMDLALQRNPSDPVSHFLFWKPGNTPYIEPEGFAWRLDPGNELVLNTHLQPHGKREVIQPTIGLYFTDHAPTRFPLLIELENDNALDIPAGASNFTVSDDFRLPMDVRALAVYPHAHYLGKLVEGYATTPGKKRIWLIRIPDWNPDWQGVYRYREPVFLPKGSVISMRFTYDNSKGNPRNPNQPPKRVEAGNRAVDEMGHLWLQVLPQERTGPDLAPPRQRGISADLGASRGSVVREVPQGHGDCRRELQEALIRHRLQKAPNDAEAHLNLGALLISRLDAQAAIDEFETSIKLNPAQPEAHNMLGSAMRSVGLSAEAAAQYRLALRIDPGYMDARYNLATTLARAGKLDEAIAGMSGVVKAFPNSSRLRNEFGELLAQKGALQAALAQFDEAVKLEPSNSYASINRDWVKRKLATR
jgi:Tfp pilus assembly protein PilF